MGKSVEDLKRIQLECARKVVTRDDFDSAETIGGMDLTFENHRKNPTRTWASLVVIEKKTLKVVYEKIIEDTVDFPYIPTFLAFREMPVLLRLYEKAEVKPDIFFIDGQGRAHPRRCGIASHFGVETGEVTVGVAKTRLFGYYDEPAPVKGSYTWLKFRGEIVGAVVRTKDRSDPMFISVGHRISLETSVKLVLESSIYRVPEPTRLAHNILQKVRQGSMF